MKKQWVTFVLAAIFAASALTGCGADGREESSQSTAGSTENAASTEQELEYVELDWYLDLGDRPDDDAVNAAFNEYLKEKLNTSVNIHYWAADEYATKVPTMVSAGQDMGILTYNTGLNYVTQSKAGAFYPLEDLMEQYGVGIQGLFSEDIWNSMTIDGHIYGVPALKDNCYIMNMIYNEEMAQELGLDMENLEFKNWRQNEEFFTEALALRDEKYPEFAGQPLINDISMEVPFYFAVETFLGNNLAVCNIDGIDDIAGYDSNTVFSLYATDEYREFCRMKQRMVANGVYAYDYSNLPDGYTQGSYLAMSGWGFTYIDDHLYSQDYTTRLKVAENIWTDTNNYTSTGSAISANCANPERAMMVLEEINTDPYLATMLRFGIEGEHWTLDDTGNMTFEGTKNEDPANRGYYFWYGASFGNLTIVNAPESLTGPDNIMLTKIEEYNNSARVPSHMGFVVDTTPITNEIAACNNVVAEYANTLAKGQYDSQEAVDAAVDAFNEKLEANGLSKILEEIQSQIDAWNSKN